MATQRREQLKDADKGIPDMSSHVSRRIPDSAALYDPGTTVVYPQLKVQYVVIVQTQLSVVVSLKQIKTNYLCLFN